MSNKRHKYFNNVPPFKPDPEHYTRKQHSWKAKPRRALFKSTPPIRVWVSSSRLKCAMNGDFEDFSSSAAAYAWFVWEKGYKGETTVKWFN